MQISEFIDKLDIDSLANLVNEFSLNIAPVTKNKIKKYFDEVMDFHEIILNSYDDIERKAVFEYYVEYQSHNYIEIDKDCETANCDDDDYFGIKELIANLWGYTEKENGIDVFRFFEDSHSVLQKNFSDKIFIADEADNNSKAGDKIIQNIDSFIEVISSDKYKYIKVGISKKICKDMIQKTNMKNESEVEFIFYFLDSINIIQKSSTGTIVVSEENMHWWLTNKPTNKIKIIDKFISSDYFLKASTEICKKDIGLIKYLLSNSGKRISLPQVKALKIINDEKLDFVVEKLTEIGLIEIENNSFVFFLQANIDTSNSVDNFMYVQPNYEITTSFLLPIDKKMFILKFAEIKSKDSAVVYQITKSSINKGFHYQLTDEDIISFLSENSISSIPQNIEFSIRDWYKLYSSIKLENVNLLTVKDDFLLHKIKSLPRLKALIVDQISDCYLIVSDYDKVKAILIQEDIILEDIKIMMNDEDIKEDAKVDLAYRKKETEDIYIPRNIKKFIHTNRLYSATNEQKILAVKYCLTKELNIEVLYDDVNDRVLNNKKVILQPIEISDMWENPDVVAYSYEHKKNYNINVNNIKRLRILMDK